jgi:hypothetical protein
MNPTFCQKNCALKQDAYLSGCLLYRWGAAFHNLEEDTYKLERKYAKYQSLELQKQVEQ